MVSGDMTAKQHKQLQEPETAAAKLKPLYYSALCFLSLSVFTYEA